MVRILTLVCCSAAVQCALGSANVDNGAVGQRSSPNARSLQHDPINSLISSPRETPDENKSEAAEDSATVTQILFARASTLLTSLVVNWRATAPSSWEFWPFDALSSPPKSQPQIPYRVQTPPLDTDWTYKVGTDPWPEYPRPQLRRDAWKSLNGIWTWRADSAPGGIGNPPSPGPLDREVLVPSCIESGLSGLQELSVSTMWYRTNFSVPLDWAGQQVLLNFESVDYEATVFVNGIQQATHVGGYNRFTVNIAHAIKFGTVNELLVYVNDPTDSKDIPVGKQTRNPSHIFYRSCSGIWQQVWLEAAPSNHVTQLDVAAGAEGEVNVHVHSSGGVSVPVKIIVWGQNGTEIARHTATSDENFVFHVRSPKMWWPDSPTLYNLTVILGSKSSPQDEVASYTGFRTISKGTVEGITRPLLNGEFVFQFGTLDQGFWPDGLYTPPNREAMVYDLRVLKEFGFNMVRKHVKIEPDLFYHACDQLGLMVIQDMPSLPANGMVPNDDELAEFKRQLEIMVNQHKSYPSIVTWVIYNEGWGQRGSNPPPEADLTRTIRELDPSRLINSVTGWWDHGYGDYHDNHNYAQPQCGTPYYSQPKSSYDTSRIGIAGEYGGIGHNVSIEHLWKVEKAIRDIPQTYEIHEDLKSYNYRSMTLMRDIREQTERFACSAAVYTQTTDVEGEVNGLLTYDRRILRPDLKQWQDDIHAIYKAAYKRGGRKPPSEKNPEDMQS